MSIEAEISAGLHAVEIEHQLDKFAQKVADYAKDIAPVFGDLPPKRGEPGMGDPGDYKDSITTMTTGKPGHRRVGSYDPKAIWIELGTRHMPEYAVFTKTAKFFGGTGPIIDEGVQHAQSKLRGELEKLAKLGAEGAAAPHIWAQRRAVAQARQARSSAFRAARGRRGR